MSDLILVRSKGAGQLASDFAASIVRDFESHARVDVIARPEPIGYEYTPLPLATELGYLFFQHAPDSQGQPFATPADIPAEFCFPMTPGEVAMATASGVQMVSGCGLVPVQPSQIPVALLKAVGVRNDAPTLPPLVEQIATAIPQCYALRKPLHCYAEPPIVPANFPRDFGVFSFPVYYDINNAPRAFVAKMTPVIQAVIDSGVRFIDLCVNASDRNVPISHWGGGVSLIKTLQSCAHEFCRLFPQIVSVTFFNGGRGKIYTEGPWAGQSVGATYLYGLQSEHLKLKSCFPTGPSRWPLPPPQPEDESMNWNLWPNVEEQIREACYCTNRDAGDTENTVNLNHARFIGEFTGESKSVSDMIWLILIKRWPTLTSADCTKPDGQPKTVREIAAGRA